MKLHIFTAVCLLALVLAGCTATVQGTMNNPAGEANLSTGSGELIGEDRAKTIALEHAGFQEADVARLHTEYEIDDGVQQYDVEFHHGEYEYEYEINAQTGAIISADKDRES